MQAIEPLTIVRARIVEPYEGIGSYRVQVERGGWMTAAYQGVSRGPLGAVESGAFQAGQTVWVAVDLSNSSQGLPATILGACAQPNQDPSQDDFPTRWTGIPWQVGYQYDESLAGKFRSGGIGSMARYYAEEATPQDVLPGDWTMTTQAGAGVGVEGWRSWLAGGPMCGVTCWSDLEMLRLTARSLQTRTLTREDEDSHEGSTALFVGRRHCYVEEALRDDPPRELQLDGALHGGRNTFIQTKARAGDPPPSGVPTGTVTPPGSGLPGPTPQPATLLHEHRGLDGSYVLRAAHSIHLVRTVAMRSPQETIPDEETASLGTGAVALPDPIITTNAEVNRTLASPRPYLTSGQIQVGVGSGATVIDDPGLAQVRVLTHLEQILNAVWKGYQGLERSGRWSFGAESPVFSSSDGAQLSPDAAGLPLVPRGMWSPNRIYNIPYDLNLPAVGVAAGTSGISLLPDGSVVLRDAWGSQITMSGGSIVISAANDVVVQPGRTALTLAGQHVVVKAHENIEIEANQGSVGIKAETQLGLLGGNGGTGGILLDCRNENIGFVPGVGSLQDHQGLTLLSRGAVTAIAPKIRLEATTNDTLPVSPSVDAPPLDGGTIDIVGPRVFLSSLWSSMAFGDNLAIRVANTQTPEESANILLDAESVTLPKVYASQVCQQGDPNDQHVQLAADVTSTALQDAALRTAQQNGLDKALFPSMGFTWQSSEQYNTLTPQEFALFEQPWQRIYKAPGAAVATRWTSNPVVAPPVDVVELRGISTTDGATELIRRRPTLSWPGYETWTRLPRYEDKMVTSTHPITHVTTTTTIQVFVPGPLVTMPLTKWWDPLTDSYDATLRDKDGPATDSSYMLPSTEGIPIDAGYVIRPSIPTPPST